MKKLSLLLIGLLITAFMVACGDSKDTTTTNSEVEQQEESASEEKVDAQVESGETAEEAETKEGNSVGDTISSDAGEATLVSLNNDVGEFESGPITMNIKKANGVHMKISDESIKEMLEGKEEIEYIQIDMEVTNTSEKHVDFLASQAEITTDTGEQLEPSMIFTEHIDAKFLGEVSKEGTNFYILENSKAEDVKEITMYFRGTIIEDDYNGREDDFEVDISLN